MEGRRLRSFTLAGEFFWTESWGPSTERTLQPGMAGPTWILRAWLDMGPMVACLSFCAFHLHSEEFNSVPVTCESDDGTRTTEQDVNPASWETAKPYFALARICLQRSCVKEKWWTGRNYSLFSLVEPNGQRPKPGPSIECSWIIILSCRWTGLPSLRAMNLEHTTLIVPKFCFQGILHTSSQRS